MEWDDKTGVWSGSAASGCTSSSLLERVKAREPGAWQRFAELYGPSIYRWCRQSRLQQADAADIAQEVFRTLVDKIAEFQRRGPGSFRAWLHAITRNKVGDHLRRVRGHVQAQGGSDAQDQLQAIAESPDSASAPDLAVEDHLLLHRALALVRSEFAERTWQAFWLVVVEQRSPAEAAEQLGMTLAAVYMAKSRVLCRLRQALDDCC